MANFSFSKSTTIIKRFKSSHGVHTPGLLAKFPLTKLPLFPDGLTLRFCKQSRVAEAVPIEIPYSEINSTIRLYLSYIQYYNEILFPKQQMYKYITCQTFA